MIMTIDNFISMIIKVGLCGGGWGISAFNVVTPTLDPSKAGVNFTNILRTAFLFESFVQSFFVLTF